MDAQTKAPNVEKNVNRETPSGSQDKLRSAFSKTGVSKIRDRLVSDDAHEITDAAHHFSLYASGIGLKNMNFLSSIYFLKGGEMMKTALQGTPEEQRAAVENVIASIVVENICQSQALLKRMMCYSEIENEKELDVIAKLNDMKAKCDSQVLRALEVKAKLTSLPGIKIGNAGQVNIGGIQQVRNDGDQKVTDSPPRGFEGDIHEA